MRRCVLFAVLLCAVVASSAQATQVGIQNDTWMIDAGSEGISDELSRADRIHASWVRIMVIGNRWPAQAGAYVQAAKAAHEHGKSVFVTLMAWDTHPTPAEWAGFAGSVVQAMGLYADAWSPMNEPNYPEMMPAQASSCIITPEGLNSWSYQISESVKKHRKWRWKRVKRGHGKFLRRYHWKRVKRGHGKFLRHRRHGRFVYHRARGHARKRANWRRGHFVYRRAHGHARKRANWRRVRRYHRSRSKTVHGSSRRAAQRACNAENSGLAYRRIWDSVAPLLRADAGAELVVSDQAPSAQNQRFMDAFYSSGQPEVQPDVLGVHPYDRSNPNRPEESDAWNVSNIAKASEYAKRHNLKLWATEWAYWPEHPPSWWPEAMSRMKDAGVKVIFIYDTPASLGHTWDTFMRPPVLSAVAAWR